MAGENNLEVQKQVVLKVYAVLIIKEVYIFERIVKIDIWVEDVGLIVVKITEDWIGLDNLIKIIVMVFSEVVVSLFILIVHFGVVGDTQVYIRIERIVVCILWGSLNTL